MMMRLRRALRAQTVPLIGGFILMAALIGARSYLIEVQAQDSLAMREAVAQERNLRTLLTLIKDAETGQRGYLLTGDRQYLEPYERARSTLPELLAQTVEDSAGDPAQLARVETISGLVDEKLTELDEVLDRWEGGDQAGAIQVVRSNFGKQTMDGIRVEIASLVSEAEETLAARTARFDERERYLRFGSIATLCVLLVLAITTIANARRRFRDVDQAQAALEASNRALQREIETRETAEQQVRQMQKMEAVGQLTGGIAHDFNNMLAIIMSAMNLVQRKLARGDTDIARFVDATVDAASRAANLTQRLLAFARQQPLAPESTDLNKLVSGMSDMLRRTIGEAIEIETVLAGGLWKTVVDVSQLENAILNLAVNARDAMDGQGKLTIETANCHLDDVYAVANPGIATGQYVLVAVTDTGSGMTEDVLSRAFEPFFTTKPVTKGTGLGLSQVFGFVKQSGGHIKIYSEPGEGTTVKIYLPRQMREIEKTQVPTAQDHEHPATGTVLLVEDDERVRFATHESLLELGYTVIVATSGAEALEIVKGDARPDILFTDIVMPGMNGRQLADAVAKVRPDLPVLFTTGFTRNAVVHNGVLDHGVNFIAKPFTVPQLAKKLREVLG